MLRFLIASPSLSKYRYDKRQNTHAGGRAHMYRKEGEEAGLLWLVRRGGASSVRLAEKNPEKSGARARKGHRGAVAYAMQCRHQFYFLEVTGVGTKRTPLGEQNVPQRKGKTYS